MSQRSLDYLVVTAELAAARSVLRRLTALATAAPALPADQLRNYVTQLAALVDLDRPPELETAMRLAEECGFSFRQVPPGAGWWGERNSAKWSEIVFLNPPNLCSATRSPRGPIAPREPLFGERVSGDALTVLHTVCHEWPIEVW